MATVCNRVGLLTLLVSLAVSPASADLLRIPADFETFEEAAMASQNGDTIQFADGNYPGPFAVEKDLTILGKLNWKSLLSGSSPPWKLKVVGSKIIPPAKKGAPFRVMARIRV